MQVGGQGFAGLRPAGPGKDRETRLPPGGYRGYCYCYCLLLHQHELPLVDAVLAAQACEINAGG